MMARTAAGLNVSLYFEVHLSIILISYGAAFQMVWIANQLQLDIPRPNVTLPELLNYESSHIVTATREASLMSHSVGVQGSFEGANPLAYPMRIWGRAHPRAMIRDTAQLRLAAHPSVCFFMKKSARFSQFFAGSHHGSQSGSAVTDLAFKIVLPIGFFPQSTT